MAGALALDISDFAVAAVSPSEQERLFSGGASPLSDSRLARIRGLANEFEAELIRDALAREGVYAWVEKTREMALAGVFIVQKAWGSMIVRRDQAEVALEVSRAVRTAYE